MPTSITLRATKGSALTHNEVDANFTNLQTTADAALPTASLGTGVAAALAVNVGSAGAFVTFNGALGTPSSGTLTNATGLPAAGVVGTAAILGANTFTALQTITAVASSALSGTLSSSGKNVTGTNTAFTSELKTGDELDIENGRWVVAITDDTHLSLDRAPAAALSGNTVTKKPASFRVVTSSGALGFSLADDGQPFSWGNDSGFVVTTRSTNEVAYTLYSPATGELRIYDDGYNNGAGTDVATVKDRKFGVGTTTPAHIITAGLSSGLGGIGVVNTGTGGSDYSACYMGNATAANDVVFFSVGPGNSAYGGGRSGGVGTNTATPFVFITNTTEKARFSADGNLGLGVTTVTAVLHIKAGTAAANTAPLKFTSGTNLTTAEAGAMEYNGTNLFFTRTGTTREGVLTQSAVTTEALTSDTSVTVNIGGTTYKLLAKA